MCTCPQPRRPPSPVRSSHSLLTLRACDTQRRQPRVGRNLETYLQQSDAMLLFLTEGYLASRNCRRELIEALRLEKPLLVIRETDANHGAVVQSELRASWPALTWTRPGAARDHFIDVLFPEAVEWYREAHLKHAALGEIVTALFQHTNERCSQFVSCRATPSRATRLAEARLATAR